MPLTDKITDRTAEESLLKTLKTGNMQGYELLYDKYCAMLYGIILRIVRDEADAENLLQDCFVKIWRNIESYDASKGRLATWLINIARNTAIDFTRSKFYAQKKANQKIEKLVSSSFDVSDLMISPDTLDVRQLVQKLPPQYRQIIEWLYFEGYTQQDISDTHGIALGTVKTRTRAALTELRQIFSEK